MPDEDKLQVLTEEIGKQLEIDIIAVIKLPLPVSGFVGLVNGLQKDFKETLYIRNCSEGYEVYKITEREKAKSPND